MDNAERRKELASLPNMTGAVIGLISIAVSRLSQVPALVAKGDNKLRERIELAINDALEELSVTRVEKAIGGAWMRKKPPTPPETSSAFTVIGAEIAAAAREWFPAFKPRIRPKLSTFMRDHARSDDGNRIRPFPFQGDMADAFVSPETSQVSCRKSSRIGYSTILQSFIAWRIRYDPARTLIYQPTIDDAEKFSRDDLDPVLQWSIVTEVATFKPRDRENQIRAKRYKGGWIQIKGANSPKEFRRVTSDDVMLEECGGYP
jgi:hypothetical protein